MHMNWRAPLGGVPHDASFLERSDQERDARQAVCPEESIDLLVVDIGVLVMQDPFVARNSRLRTWRGSPVRNRCALTLKADARHQH